MIKKILKTQICILIMFLCLSITSYANESVPQNVIDATDSVYRITSVGNEDFFLGSSFIIYSNNSETYLATNFHVIDNSNNDIYIIDRDGEKKSASLVIWIEESDIAIIKVSSRLSGTPLPLNKDNYKKRRSSICNWISWCSRYYK